MNLIIEQNKLDGEFHTITLENPIHFVPENNVVLNSFKYPQTVIWAFIAGRAPFPIANFSSRVQRDNIFRKIHHLDRIRYNDLYEQIFPDHHATALLRSQHNLDNYLAREIQRLQQKGIYTPAIFKNISRLDMQRIANGGNPPSVDVLPSVEDLSKTLKTPRLILEFGITPIQFFNFIINEKYSRHHSDPDSELMRSSSNQ